MNFAATVSAVQTVFAALQCGKLKEVCSVLGKQSELDEFSKTVCDVLALLLDLRAKQEELSHEVLVWVEEVKDVVYDVGDLLDEFVTLSEQKQLVEDGQVSEEVCLFFSRFHPVNLGNFMSLRFKNIREKIGAIAGQNDQFEFRKNEDCSYLYGKDFIGRDDDLDNVVGMLLDSNVQHDVSVLSIMGVGGVGKTALARLLFNDQRVAKAFPLRLWTCVSDIDQKEFDVDEVLGKIVKSATDQTYYNRYEMGKVRDQLMEHIEGRKYLLVLDDVQTENREQWLKLVEVLMAGKRGSRIIVTTRSRETITEAIGDGANYELQGLSEENSWCLFEQTAFGVATIHDNLVETGQEIVKVCVKVVGSLLYGQDESRWICFRDSGRVKGNIKSVLKLSYDHLEPGLQTCFSYCALFPRDFEIQKDLLISLWISQGFIAPLKGNLSIEDAGEEYFSILLQRCFFQDVKKDEYGEIVSCKIQDLMHDFARELAGKEISVAISVTSDLHKNILHLSGAINTSTEINFSAKTRLRSYFQVGRMDLMPLNQLVENCISLRTLVLRDSDIKTLPDSIGNLLHLRCIDLSENSSLEVLPNSITNLYNLQTLKLRSCIRLKELPKDLSKLANLKVFDIAYCYRLSYVPSDLHKLTSLHTLSDYRVCVASASSSQCFDQLEGLKSLVNLKGHLWIKLWLSTNAAYVKEDGKEGAYMKNKEHLKYVRYEFQHSQGYLKDDYELPLLEDLQPHSNLKGVVFSEYSSTRLPSWVKDENLSTFLPNLARLQFVRCKKLQFLPCLGKLHHLKSLFLLDLPMLECLETSSTGSSEEVQSVFPCLEDLSLSGLPKLKGFRKEEVEDFISAESSTNTRKGKKTKTRVKKGKLRQLPFSLYLPKLKSLEIRDCPELASTIQCPRIEDMTLRAFNKKLTVKIPSDPETKGNPKLLSVITDNITWLNLLPVEAFQNLSHICIYWDEELESLSEVEGVFRSCSFSLRSLVICHCPKLRSLSGGLEHLHVLETLVLEYIANLVLTASQEEERNQDGKPWSSLSQSLRSLELSSLPNIVRLPKGMQYLTSLRSLTIYDCIELKSIPRWIEELVSLKQLNVQGCSELCEW